MRKVDPAEFLRDVLEDIGDLPEGFADKLVALADSPQSSRPTKIRDLFAKVTHA